MMRFIIIDDEILKILILYIEPFKNIIIEFSWLDFSFKCIQFYSSNAPTWCLMDLRFEVVQTEGM